MANIILSKKKKYQTAFELHCTSQNLYAETIRLSHRVLWSILYKFPRKVLFFFLFSPNVVFFFSVYTILNKFELGTIRVDPCFPFLKNDEFLSKAHIRVTLYFYFIFNGSFFCFEIFLTNINHGQYGLSCILHFNQFLSKTDMVRFALYLQKFSVNLYQETIPFERSCPFKDSQ